jgi:hypothetical protein
MSGLKTFGRAMRRHEKRARAMGDISVATDMRRIRLAPCFDGDDSCEELRGAARAFGGSTGDRNRRRAFLYSLAADAVARLRAAPLYVCDPAEFGG